MNQKVKITLVVVLCVALVSAGAVVLRKTLTKNNETKQGTSSSSSVSTSATDSQSDSQTETGSVSESTSGSTSESTSAKTTTTSTTDSGKVTAGLFTTDTTYRNSHKYCIAVNTAQNIVIIYSKDADGNYTKPYKAMVASCGLDSSPTKLGTYYTKVKYRWRALNGNVYGQYATRIDGPYLFHSVPYKAQSADSLKWEEYNKLGSRASEGCVRLSVADAKWIYDNCEIGTCVYLYSDASKQEPMVKPSAQKIPADSPNKGWDPTDPSSDNPWNK